ncbi:unnamed protein product [Caenorhabditis brenneri]
MTLPSYLIPNVPYPHHFTIILHRSAGKNKKLHRLPSSSREAVTEKSRTMTDFELKNLTNEPSSDNLSLKNWTLPEQKVTEKVEEKKEEKKVEEKKKEVKVLDGIQSLVPQYVRDMCKNNLISSELRVSYDAPTNQSTYIYSITWEDQEDGPQEQVSTVVTKKVEQEPKLEAVKTVSSQKIAAVVPVTAKCDGPCKKEFPSNLLSTIGRCGHYLCSACYGIVKETDGTVGCSSRTCFWKGASREESKKNYEKDVCQKQREKALDMNSRGIDVKPASAASSIQELSSKSTASMPITSETIQQSSVNLKVISSYKKPAEPKAPIKVRLIIVESSVAYGMTHTYIEKPFKAGSSFVKVMRRLLRRKRRNPDLYLPKGNIYYGLLKDNDKLGMRRIRMTSYDSLTIDDVPKLGERLVLIMDMDNYVTKGVRIYLE